MDLAHFTPQTVLVLTFYIAGSVCLAATLGAIATLFFMKVLKLREAMLLIQGLETQLSELVKSPDPAMAALAAKLYKNLVGTQEPQP
jgi:hypothetical protein